MAFKPYWSQAYQDFRHFPLAFHPRMSRTNESKKWITKFQNLRKFTQQLLPTSSEQKHTEQKSTTWWPPFSFYYGLRPSSQLCIELLAQSLLHGFFGRNPCTTIAIPAEKSNRILLLPVNRQQTGVVSFSLCNSHLSTSNDTWKN